MHTSASLRVTPHSSLPLRRDTRGAQLVEYLILVGMIAVLALAGFHAFGRSASSKAEAQAACVDSLDCSGGASDYPLTEAEPIAASASPLLDALHDGMSWAGSLGEEEMLLHKATLVPMAMAAQQEPELLEPKGGLLDPSKVGVVLNNQPELMPTGQQLEDLGVTAARISIPRKHFDGSPANVANWQRVLADYREHHIEITINIQQEAADGFPPGPSNWEWHKPEEPAVVEARLAELRTWKETKYLPKVQEIMTVMGPYAQAYEVYNEPDQLINSDKYSPALPPAFYGELLRDTYQTIKNGPDNLDGQRPRVITAGLDSGQTGYLTEAVKGSDGILYADAIGLHPYAKDPLVKPPAEGSLRRILDEYAAFPVKTPSGETTTLPVYVTEASQPSTEPTDVKAYINNAAVVAGETPGIAKTYFFWNKTSDDHAGMVEYVDGKPVATPAYEQLARRLGKPCDTPCVIH